MPHSSDACHAITDYTKGEAWLWGGVQQHDACNNVTCLKSSNWSTYRHTQNSDLIYLFPNVKITVMALARTRTRTHTHTWQKPRNSSTACQTKFTWKRIYSMAWVIIREGEGVRGLASEPPPSRSSNVAAHISATAHFYLD
jgi:hypothetical protein